MTTSLVRSLAWPVVVLAVTVLFRTAISSTLGGQIKRLKLGPVEADFEQTLAEVREDLPKESEDEQDVERAITAGLVDDLVAIAEVSPDAAVVEAFRHVEKVLRRRAEEEGVLAADGRFVPAWRVAQDLYAKGRMSASLLKAIRHLTDLRNRAAHGGPADLDLSMALAYVDLVGSVLFQLEREASA